MASKEYYKEIRELNRQKMYTKKQILSSKFKNKYIDTYFYHTELWNDSTHKYETVAEVRKVSSIEKENLESPSAVARRMD